MSKKIQVEQVVEVSSVPEVSYDLSKFTTKSAMIRYLDSEGVKRGRIAKILSEHFGKTVRYQHVRNVLVTMIKTK